MSTETPKILIKTTAALTTALAMFAPEINASLAYSEKPSVRINIERSNHQKNELFKSISDSNYPIVVNFNEHTSLTTPRIKHRGGSYTIESENMVVHFSGPILEAKPVKADDGHSSSFEFIDLFRPEVEDVGEIKRTLSDLFEEDSKTFLEVDENDPPFKRNIVLEEEYVAEVEFAGNLKRPLYSLD